jgi:hypothetical protein
MTDRFPDNWRECSTTGIFCFIYNPEILPVDAECIEGVLKLLMKVLHDTAARNKAKQDAKSAETMKACAEFWDDCEKHWQSLKPTELESSDA